MTVLGNPGIPKQWGPLFAGSPSRRSRFSSGAPGAPGIHPDE